MFGGKLKVWQHKGRKKMCQQLEILEKIREKGKVNGYDIDLAEAQAKDYIRMDKKVGKIEKAVASIKKEQKKQGEMLARQGGQIDLIVVLFEHKSVGLGSDITQDAAKNSALIVATPTIRREPKKHQSVLHFGSFDTQFNRSPAQANNIHKCLCLRR